MTDIVFRPSWEAWERVIFKNGITLDRLQGSVHPIHEDIIYPLDYGYVNGTMGTDGEQLDIFVGSRINGLIAAILTTDFQKGDRECKLIFNCTPEEVYLVNGFINFDASRMTGTLVMRRPMQELWRASEGR